MIIQDRHRKDKISQLANTPIGDIVLKGMTKEEIANLEPEDIMTRQVEALEKETAAKLAEMDQYNKDMQVGISYNNSFQIILHNL